MLWSVARTLLLFLATKAVAFDARKYEWKGGEVIMYYEKKTGNYHQATVLELHECKIPRNRCFKCGENYRLVNYPVTGKGERNKLVHLCKSACSRLMIRDPNNKMSRSPIVPISLNRIQSLLAKSEETLRLSSSSNGGFEVTDSKQVVPAFSGYAQGVVPGKFVKLESIDRRITSRFDLGVNIRKTVMVVGRRVCKFFIGLFPVVGSVILNMFGAVGDTGKLYKIWIAKPKMHITKQEAQIRCLEKAAKAVGALFLERDEARDRGDNHTVNLKQAAINNLLNGPDYETTADGYEDTTELQ